jgi:hypothetical protein
VRRSAVSIFGVVAAVALVGGLILEPWFPAVAEEGESGSPSEAEILELRLESEDAPGPAMRADVRNG